MMIISIPFPHTFTHFNVIHDIYISLFWVYYNNNHRWLTMTDQRFIPDIFTILLPSDGTMRTPNTLKIHAYPQRRTSAIQLMIKIPTNQKDTDSQQDCAGRNLQIVIHRHRCQYTDDVRNTPINQEDHGEECTTIKTLCMVDTKTPFVSIERIQ
mmetsp:Transcript_3790/g.10640  ORF Transcript_3790/g.10640 Transcript_3790/m.10640 type:complete len:154 (+) Transcript_3790:1194-1655(+)